jgi:hypothetical protein
VRCWCAVLAQMNQMMVNMNSTMSLTAIDERLMMKWAIVLALLTLSQWRALTVMWWHDFGDSHQSRFKTQFWWCSWSDPTKPNQFGIGPNQLGLGPIKLDWAQSGARFWRCSQFWWWPLEIRELIFPQKMLKIPDSDYLWSVPQSYFEPIPLVLCALHNPVVVE